jgi:hypothetical protein
MNYKQVLFYAVFFIVGFVVGKALKIDIKTKNGCPIARKKLDELRKQLQSESSENYL